MPIEAAAPRAEAAENAVAVRAGVDQVQKRFGLKPKVADELVKWLTAEESRLFELEELIPQDALRVKLRIGDQYHSLEQLSVGQGATAVLFLLFGLGGGILMGFGGFGFPAVLVCLATLIGGALGLRAAFAITTQEPRISMQEDTTLRAYQRR